MTKTHHLQPPGLRPRVQDLLGRRCLRRGRRLPERAVLPEVLQRRGRLPPQRGLQGRRLQAHLQQQQPVRRRDRLHRQDVRGRMLQRLTVRDQRGVFSKI